MSRTQNSEVGGFPGFSPLALGRECLGGAFGDHSQTDSQITSWKAQLEGGAADVFGPGGNGAAQPTVDVKSLHAKIGELTLENDFLEGALGKAGLLSARR